MLMVFFPLKWEMLKLVHMERNVPVERGILMYKGKEIVVRTDF